MAAIVGYVVGESFTEPEIAEIAVSEAENLVYIRRAGAAGFDGIESLEVLLESADGRGLDPRRRRRHRAGRDGGSLVEAGD